MTREKHLELIQGVINRMAGNSFHLKGWSVVLVSALFALAANDARVYFVYLAYLPAIAFWVLDGYFLWQERMYRKLYDAVRAEKTPDSDFSMNAYKYEKEARSWADACFSKTLLIFHGMVLAAVLIVMVLMLVLG
ncbi:MAG: hypothetical protein JW741_10500 [Sedimentisphaerales bacterium]|nr:hypothetical protein [Sedimentisphaerales bacterium]